MSFTKKDITSNDIQRILSRIYINSNTCCVEWIGCLDKGYGRISLNGALEHVHLIMYRHFKGNYNKNKFVIRHTCDNKKCCNPYHLIKGTQSQNMKDWHKRKR
ncbi:HNH endonuclease [Candidatus Pacearchaeota archaeon]|nr:HNH endonuclease [Candidatus Pacearchaeota archaeon]